MADLEQALAGLRGAVEFFDKVELSSTDERAAVGRGHWDWLCRAAREVAAAASPPLDLMDDPAVALAAVVDAWNQLPEGYYSPTEVDAWLHTSMKPAIDRARVVLQANLAMSGGL